MREGSHAAKETRFGSHAHASSPSRAGSHPRVKHQTCQNVSTSLAFRGSSSEFIECRIQPHINHKTLICKASTGCSWLPFMQCHFFVKFGHANLRIRKGDQSKLEFITRLFFSLMFAQPLIISIDPIEQVKRIKRKRLSEYVRNEGESYNPGIPVLPLGCFQYRKVSLLK